MTIGPQLVAGGIMGFFMAFIALLLTEHARRRWPRIVIGMGLAGFGGMFMGVWAVPMAMSCALLLAWANWLKPLADAVLLALYGLVSALMGSAKRSRRSPSGRGRRWIGAGGRSGGGGAPGSW
ncbi:hypothetical protein [Stenotrophomonas nitritireducens]|nr:hypothetical protein [Stenotrophomonas nitritireducens]